MDPIQTLEFQITGTGTGIGVSGQGAASGSVSGRAKAQKRVRFDVPAEETKLEHTGSLTGHYLKAKPPKSNRPPMPQYRKSAAEKLQTMKKQTEGADKTLQNLIQINQTALGNSK